MLRIAVPNKGMLSEPAWQMLAEAGYELRKNPRQLVVMDPGNDVELFYLRPLDIAVYVGRGAIDVGITGRDLLLDSNTSAQEHMELGFGASTFRFAAPLDSDIHTLADIDGKRVASSYDTVVADYLQGHGVKAPMSCPPGLRCATRACEPLANRSLILKLYLSVPKIYVPTMNDLLYFHVVCKAC
jgi:ATP phosphoribosyltransferase